MNHSTALLLVDVQQGLDNHKYYGGQRNNPAAEEMIKRLLDFFRVHHLPVYHIQHASLRSDSPLHSSRSGFELKEIVRPAPDEHLIIKTTSSAFFNTPLNERLKSDNINSIIVVGLTTDHCVSSTVRMGSDLGYNMIVISDATATFPKLDIYDRVVNADSVHQVALASLRNEFATIFTTDQMLNILSMNTSAVI